MTRSVIVLVLLATACSSSSSPTPDASSTQEQDPVAALAAAAGCEAPAEHPPTSQEHVPEGLIAYDRLPPDGGAHRPSWANTGIHDTPIEDGLQVHNLEHGHVGLQYAPGTDPALVAVLHEHARLQPSFVFVAPYEGFEAGAGLALTSWGHRVDCGAGPTDPGALDALAQAFLEQHLDQAPESVPGEPQG